MGFPDQVYYSLVASTLLPCLLVAIGPLVARGRVDQPVRLRAVSLVSLRRPERVV
ncbi:hypothetical protein BDV19DRAFT_374385, partial [Aspergillus venezuelensis]